jgi:hypothetical protein
MDDGVRARSLLQGPTLVCERQSPDWSHRHVGALVLAGTEEQAAPRRPPRRFPMIALSLATVPRSMKADRIVRDGAANSALEFGTPVSTIRPPGGTPRCRRMPLN